MAVWRKTVRVMTIQNKKPFREMTIQRKTIREMIIQYKNRS